MKDRFLPARGRASEGCIGEGTLEKGWVVGVQGTWGRPTGRRADLGGDLRARARFNCVDSCLLKWETKDDIFWNGIPLPFTNMC